MTGIDAIRTALSDTRTAKHVVHIYASNYFGLKPGECSNEQLLDIASAIRTDNPRREPAPPRAWGDWDDPQGVPPPQDGDRAMWDTNVPAAAVIARLGGSGDRADCPLCYSPGHHGNALQITDSNDGGLWIHCHSLRHPKIPRGRYWDTWGPALGLTLLRGQPARVAQAKAKKAPRRPPAPQIAYCASEPTLSVRDIKNALIHGVRMDKAGGGKLAAEWQDGDVYRVYRTSLSNGGTLYEARFGGDIVQDGKAKRVAPWTSHQGAVRGTEHLRAHQIVPSATPTTFLTGSEEVPHPLRFTVLDLDYHPDEDVDGRGDALRRRLRERLQSLGMPMFYSSRGDGLHALFTTDGAPDPKMPLRIPSRKEGGDVRGCGVDVFTAGGSGRHVAIQYDRPVGDALDAIPVLDREAVLETIKSEFQTTGGKK